MTRGRLGLGAPLVVAAAWLACLAPESAAGAPQSTYQAIVDQYRSGNADAAVVALLGWSRARLASEARPGKFPRDTGMRVAAAALHTEAAIQHTSLPLSSVHFQIARAVVAGLDVNADTRLFRRAWHISAMSYLLRWGALTWAGAVVDRMPRDVAETPEAHALVGMYYELSAETPGSPRANVRDLTTAAGHYRVAVSARPGLAQTRLHLGRVLLLLDRTGEGIAELERVTAETPDPSLKYLVWLFMGEDHERAGRLEAAVTCYRAALDLVPGGQAANLSLGRALLVTGLRPEAAEVATRILDPDNSMTAPPESDPWWAYRHGRVSPFGLELASLRKTARR